MLRIVVNTSAKGAKGYYTSADYYSEGQELTGQWQGKGAARLGLRGEVEKTQWDALCDNKNPVTGDKLMPRTKSERRIGYDFNFHAPKSLSLLYELTGDERLLTAFEKSVQDTMQELEREAATRVRKDGANSDRITGNLVWGSFTHLTARPVDGTPDPHLHTHCFVFNTTFDKEENRWKAAQLGGIKQDAPYFEAVFHSTLARRIEALGLATQRTKTGWEIAGLDESTLTKFSRRTSAIEATAQRLGIDDPTLKAELGVKTRSRKAKEMTMPELKALWKSSLTPPEQKTIDELGHKIGSAPIGEDDKAGREAMQRALDTAFERASVVPERMLLAAALKQGVGKASRRTMENLAKREQLISAQRDGRTFVTTREVLNEERAMLEFARNGRGACKPVTSKPTTFTRDWLNDQQRSAVRHVLNSRDRVILIRGAAGVGKTSALQELREQCEGQGVRVHAFAPSAEASRKGLRKEGFESADTIARLLLDPQMQSQVKGGFILVDEAGQVGTKSMKKLFDVAAQADARVVLVGDIYQHGSVERGAALRLLETEAGLLPAEIKEIQRQKSTYKEAIKHLSEGNTKRGFDTLNKLGWIREVPDEDRNGVLAAAYINTVKEGKTALVVSPTHAEGDRIADEIRSGMRAKGMMGKESTKLTRLVPTNYTLGERKDALMYHPGDVLVFHQNAKGFVKGQKVIVTAPEQPPVQEPVNSNAKRTKATQFTSHVTIDDLPLDQAERFNVFNQATMEVSPGDRIRITANSTTKDGHRIYNGDVFSVKSLTKHGDLVLDNGWTVAKDFGHVTYGLVITSHTSQSKTVDRVFIGQSSWSFNASSREQFYVSASRGREQAIVFTDSKPTLLEAVSQSDPRLSATELVATQSQSQRIDSTRRLVRNRLMQTPIKTQQGKHPPIKPPTVKQPQHVLARQRREAVIER